MVFTPDHWRFAENQKISGCLWLDVLIWLRDGARWVGAWCNCCSLRPLWIPQAAMCWTAAWLEHGERNLREMLKFHWLNGLTIPLFSRSCSQQTSGISPRFNGSFFRTIPALSLPAYDAGVGLIMNRLTAWGHRSFRVFAVGSGERGIALDKIGASSALQTGGLARCLNSKDWVKQRCKTL